MTKLPAPHTDTTAASTAGPAHSERAQLFIVAIADQREPRLCGHTGCTYTSPPQPADQALALVRALLGCPPARLTTADGTWRIPIPGGQRLIQLHLAERDGQLTIS